MDMIMAVVQAFADNQLVSLFMNLGGGAASIAILCYAFLKEFPRQREQNEKVLQTLTQIQSENSKTVERIVADFRQELHSQREECAQERVQAADEREKDRQARHAMANAVNANNLSTANAVVSFEKSERKIDEIATVTKVAASNIETAVATMRRNG